MKKILFALGGVAAFVAASAVVPQVASASEPYNASAFPHDKASILALNDKQLSILRRAVRYCGTFGRTRHNRDFCVLTNTDLDVRQSGDKALIAFHRVLPVTDRYDERRSWVQLKRLIKP